MLYGFKILFAVIISSALMFDFCFAQTTVLGSVSIDRYKASFKEDYSSYQMYLGLKDGNIIPTALDDDGNFKFQTQANAQSFESIWWDRPENKSGKNSNSKKIGHVIWPLNATISSPPPYNFFEYDKFNEIHFKEKRNILQRIRAGKFDDANMITEKLVSLYDFGTVRLGEETSIKMKIALYKDMCHEASQYRNKVGLSKYSDNMIENERVWLRDLIVFTSDVNYLCPDYVSCLIITLNNWAYFSRQAYSNKQRRWPNQPLSELELKDAVFRKDKFKDWLSEDLLLIEEVFSTPEIVAELEQLIQKWQKEKLNVDLRVAIDNFPGNVQLAHEEIKLAEMSNLFNGLNQMRRKQ